MKLSQFKFDLPKEKIALHPTMFRDDSRSMVLHKNEERIEHKKFKDVLDYFDEHDIFVFNDTKVFPARLYGYKEKTGAKIVESEAKIVRIIYKLRLMTKLQTNIKKKMKR